MRNWTKIAIAAAMAAGLAGTAVAGLQERSAEYQAARDQGLVGEQPDGYLGIVGTPTPALRAMVNELNIQRKKAYTQGAGNDSTIEQFAFVTGCNLILKTEPGEKYMTPTGEWMTRTTATPIRADSCLKAK